MRLECGYGKVIGGGFVAMNGGNSRTSKKNMIARAA
jgi:hypothetical protein